jgi:hypothetical protein
LVNPKIKIQIKTERGIVILIGINKYDKAKYTERPESILPAKDKKIVDANCHPV